MKLNTNLLINMLVIGFIVFALVICYMSYYFTTGNKGYKQAPDKNHDSYSYINNLPDVDPPISTDLPYNQYQQLKNRLSIVRQLRNGEFIGAGGVQIGEVVGTGGGILCDTCTINHNLKSFLDFEKYPIQHYIHLYGWKLNTATNDPWNPDPVMFYVEHRQSYVRKRIVEKSITEKNGDKQHLLRQVDVPVKFKYDTQQNFIMIPVSKSGWYIGNTIIVCVLVLLVTYVLYLIAAFLKLIVDVSKGLSFTVKNVFRLKIIGFSLLGFPVIAFLLNLLMKPIFYNYFTDDVVLNNKIWMNDWKIMSVGIIFLLLYKAFRQGKKLKDEQDLTV